MNPIPLQEDTYDIGMGCCASDQLSSLNSLSKIEYGGQGGQSNPAPPNLKARLSSKAVPSNLVKGSKFLKSKLAKGLPSAAGRSNGDEDWHVSPQSVAHKHFSNKKNTPPPEMLVMNSLMDGSGSHQSDSHDCAQTACSGSGESVSPEDALALEVGQNAYEYLEECFYTEAKVLSRKRFDAIPQVDQMSDFMVQSHLGKGNFSDVFHVVFDGGPHGRLDYAMKSLRPQIMADEDQFIIGSEDLVHETAILANLDHQHIIKLHGRAAGSLPDAFLNGGYFILLDKLNETLHNRMAAWKLNNHLLQDSTTPEQLEVAHSIADAMSYLHSREIVFRDLKPDNVGFDYHGEVKMFDFGFAIGLPEEDEENPDGFLYDRCGTPRYMAPEVGFELGYGTKADVYSFGALLWEMCALEKPFADIRSADEFEKLVFMGGQRPPMDSSWPQDVRDLMSSCWSATPETRPSMSDVQSLLASMCKVKREST